LSAESSELGDKGLLPSFNALGSTAEVLDRLFDSLQDIASSSSVLVTITQGQVCTILNNNDRKWYRATVIRLCDKFQIKQFSKSLLKELDY